MGFKGQSFSVKAAVAYKITATSVGAVLGATVIVALAHSSAVTNDVKIPKAARLAVWRAKLIPDAHRLRGRMDASGIRQYIHETNMF